MDFKHYTVCGVSYDSAYMGYVRFDIVPVPKLNWQWGGLVLTRQCRAAHLTANQEPLLFLDVNTLLWLCTLCLSRGYNYVFFLSCMDRTNWVSPRDYDHITLQLEKVQRPGELTLSYTPWLLV
jgi:hypothetical protein